MFEEYFNGILSPMTYFRQYHYFVQITVLLALAACSGAQPKPTVPVATRNAAATAALSTIAVPSAVAVATQEATAVPQNLPTPQITTQAVAVAESRTAEGYYYLGKADAPNTIVMYSDVF